MGAAQDEMIACVSPAEVEALIASAGFTAPASCFQARSCGDGSRHAFLARLDYLA